MRKRIIFKYALTLMLLLGILGSGCFTALAAGEVTVQVNDVSVSPGETVTTDLIMNGTFAGFQGRLLYDSDALTLENIEASDAISGSMTMFNQDDITDEFLDGTFISASTSNMTVDGAVLTFTFTASDNASGTYSFSVEQFLVSDADGTELTVNTVDTVIDRGVLEPTNSEPEDTDQTGSEGANSESTGSGSTDTEQTSSASANSESTDSENTNSELTASEQAGPESTTGDSASSESGSNTWIIVVIVLVVVVVGAVVAVVVVRNKKANTQIEDSNQEDDDQTEEVEDTENDDEE